MGIEDDLTELAAGLPEESAEGKKISPVRSNGGNIRAVGQMNPEKFWPLREEMQQFKEKDPDGYAVVEKQALERAERGELPPAS